MGLGLEEEAVLDASWEGSVLQVVEAARAPQGRRRSCDCASPGVIVDMRGVMGV